MLKVFVGQDEKVFVLHKRLVCQASPYFKAAVEWKGGESPNELRLPEQDPESFNHFAEWIYTGGFHLPNINGEASHDDMVWMIFSKTYLLAKFLQCRNFGNWALSSAPTVPFSTPTKFGLPKSAIVKMVYANTVEGDGIRKYLVAVYVWMTKDIYADDKKLLDLLFATLPAEFVQDIAKFYIRGISKNKWNPFGIGVLDMHVFGDKQ